MHGTLTFEETKQSDETRRPVLLGLIALSGVGMIAASQIRIGSPDPVSLPGKDSLRLGDLTASLPLPQFGAEPAAVASPAANQAGPDAALPRAADRALESRSNAIGYTRSGQRYVGAFSVPSISGNSIAIVLPTPTVESAPAAPPLPVVVAPAAAMIAPAPQVESLAAVSASPRSASVDPAPTAAAPDLPQAVAEPAPVALAPVVRPVLPAATPSRSVYLPEPSAPAPALASPGGIAGIEGMAGLDDSQLSSVRPIIGEPREQQAAAAKRRSADDAPQPNARTSAEDDGANAPDQISALELGVELGVPLRVGNHVAGTLPLRIGVDGTISVKLGHLLAMAEGQIPSDTMQQLRDSSAAQATVSTADLRAAGIALRYDAAKGVATLASA